MEFTTDIGIYAAISLGVGAVVLGVVLQLIGDVRFGFEWVITAVAAFAGGFVCTEWITAFRTVEPVWDSMAIIPAAGGALVVGVVVDAIIRFTTHGSYTHHVPVS
jgi:uncharacterized membrane protein YeaQ/YmgE (transglycosylase-associated protein family)